MERTKRRVIPCLDIKDGRVVKGVKFTNLKAVGDPVELARHYNESGAELVILDISATQTGHALMLDAIRNIAEQIDIPLIIGGGIKSLEDIAAVLEAGAARVSMNSAVIRDPDLINCAAERFGSERICIGIDTVYVPEQKDWFCITHGGKQVSERRFLDWAVECEERGAGELLVTSKDSDGMKHGFDVEAMQVLATLVSLPIIAAGGAGNARDFLSLFKQTDVTAGLAASIFHEGLVSIQEIKDLCRSGGIPVYD